MTSSANVVRPVTSMTVASDTSQLQQANEERNQADEIQFGTFTCFPRLPFELRRKIVKEACKVSRILNVLGNSYSLTCIPSSFVNPAILYASSETRATALEALKPVFHIHIEAQYNHGRAGPLSKSKDAFGKVLILSEDILYFNFNCAYDEFEAATATLTFPDIRAFLGITRMAFDTTVLKDTHFGAYKWLRVLAWTCPAMNFILVDRPAPPPVNHLPSAMQAEDQQENSEGHIQVSDSRSQRVLQVRSGGPLEMIDLTEATYTA
ncbi:hypothetical protein BKA64DRAFT_707602 [Cadophora sp. MPI-SDFR-AT-0126]|nr:hypothetical protein BKA64DRAFT_707602 [Leotiomycetes sp. MPI-SDFR-AT-0126]